MGKTKTKIQNIRFRQKLRTTSHLCVCRSDLIRRSGLRCCVQGKWNRTKRKTKKKTSQVGKNRWTWEIAGALHNPGRREPTGHGNLSNFLIASRWVHKGGADSIKGGKEKTGKGRWLHHGQCDKSRVCSTDLRTSQAFTWNDVLTVFNSPWKRTLRSLFSHA